MIITIDQREPEELKDYFKKNYLNSTLCNLQLGDIMIESNDLKLIIERKTITDLASSIRDGRLREQKIRLIKNYNRKNIIYIIEGNITKNNNSIHFNKINKYTVYSSIINMLVRDNINIFMSSDIQNTIEFIEMLIKKMKKGTLKIIKYNKGDNEQQEKQEELYDQTRIKNISRSIHIDKSKNITPHIIYKSQLCCIPGISITTADAIINKYPNLCIFMGSLSVLEDNDRIEVLKNIKTLKSRKIGIKIATNINIYLFNT